MIWVFQIDCLQPDGSWKSYTRAFGRRRYDVTAEASPGPSSLRFKYNFLMVINDGDEAGNIWARLEDDRGRTIWSSSQHLEPGLGFYNTDVIYVDMPDREYVLTFKTGHGAVEDDEVSLVVRPVAKAGVEIPWLPAMLVGAGFITAMLSIYLLR